jgi:hypothetical protein
MGAQDFSPWRKPWESTDQIQAPSKIPGPLPEGEGVPPRGTGEGSFEPGSAESFCNSAAFYFDKTNRGVIPHGETTLRFYLLALQVIVSAAARAIRRRSRRETA